MTPSSEAAHDARDGHVQGQSPLSRGAWHSLRGRAALAFALLALVLTAAMAIGVWVTVSQFLVLQRERSTVAQTITNAQQVENGLAVEGANAPEQLSRLSREIGSTSLLVHDGAWHTTSLQFGRDDLPGELRNVVLEGQPSRQRIDVGGETMLAVGVPLDDGTAYFEVFPVAELNRILRTLGLVLVAATLIVPLLALALGWWVTRPALQPLTRLSDAAGAIAEGALDTRIDPRGDPQLIPIARSFNETAAALERRVRADARFAADVAHELRSPLTTMLSAVALVDEYRESLPAGGREALELLASEVQRFTRLVQDLLEISRADAGSADLDLSDVNLHHLVRWTVPDHLRSRLLIDDAAQDLRVRADKRRLERAVANLVENAETHGGGLSSLTVTRAGDQALVIVDDAGPGVRESDRERIFERFARGPGSARVTSDGAGLGLSLVARHVHLLGGEVSVEDSPHGGARFVIALPVEAP